MAEIGPVTLEEARDVLHDRLVTLELGAVGAAATADCSSARRIRRAAARSASSSCPGLAERVVPQRPREDPLLLDDARRRDRCAALVRQDERGAAERLLLKIAIGAATERLYLSYPRLDVAETRARVPSFYALDVDARDHRPRARITACSRRRRPRKAARAWRGRRPSDPDRAIDDLEHDLAVAQAAARRARSVGASRATRTICSA